MPATNFCKKKVNPREAETRAMIAAGLKRKGLDKKQLARKTGIPYSSLTEKIREMDKMKLVDLWKIIDVLQPTEEEMGRLL